MGKNYFLRVGVKPTKEGNKLLCKAKTKKGKGRPVGANPWVIFTQICNAEGVCDCPWETSGGAENKVF